jgi:hypothetical protein
MRGVGGNKEGAKGEEKEGGKGEKGKRGGKAVAFGDLNV